MACSVSLVSFVAFIALTTAAVQVSSENSDSRHNLFDLNFLTRLYGYGEHLADTARKFTYGVTDVSDISAVSGGTEGTTGSTLIINPISTGVGCLVIAGIIILLIWGVLLVAVPTAATSFKGYSQPYLRYGNPDIPFHRSDPYDHVAPNSQYPNWWSLSPTELILAAKVHDSLQHFGDLNTPSRN